jgi:hypothetical protein
MPIEIRVGGKQQQPVDDQRDAAKYRQSEVKRVSRLKGWRLKR